MSIISVPYLEMDRTARLTALEHHKYPLPTNDLLTPPGWTTPYRIRPNRVLVRPYQPKGQTPGGIYLERNEKWPPIFGHILAISREASDHHDLYPGDMVCYKHLTDTTLDEEYPQNPRYIGEVCEIVLLHIESIRFVFDPTPVRFRL